VRGRRGSQCLPSFFVTLSSFGDYTMVRRKTKKVLLLASTLQSCVMYLPNLHWWWTLKLTHCGHLDVHDETVPKCVLERHQKECGDEAYKAKYMALKVSLDYSRAKRVVPMLANALPLLAEKCIVLHDIDFARDCCYITTRAHLVAHINDGKAGKVVEDCHKVGDHCISWKGRKKNGTENSHFKVYNKFIPALESADV
jgi:hypothetical protein